MLHIAMLCPYVEVPLLVTLSHQRCREDSAAFDPRRIKVDLCYRPRLTKVLQRRSSKSKTAEFRTSSVILARMWFGPMLSTYASVVVLRIRTREVLPMIQNHCVAQPPSHAFLGRPTFFGDQLQQVRVHDVEECMLCLLWAKRLLLRWY